MPSPHHRWAPSWRLRATGLSKFIPGDDGDKGDKGGSGRSRQQSGPESAEQDIRDAVKEAEDLWNMPVIPWKEFFEKLTPPPSPTKLPQRLRLNANYYKANYLVITCALTLLLAACVEPYIWLGFALGILSGMIRSIYWVNALSPKIKKITGNSMYLMLDPEEGARPTLMITKPNNTQTRGSSVISVGEEQLVRTMDARTVSMFLSLWSSYLLISMPVRSIVVAGVAGAVAGLLCFLHASLRQPGIKSSLTGLLNIKSRSELDENLRTLWDLARGKGDRN